MKSILGACALAAITAAAAELPVKTVILYKHGVGYFERNGELRAGESARLDFRAGDMNDVLKSLTIEDRGGKITGLRYDASEPLDKRLADYPFQIGPHIALSAFFDQLKGARLELRTGAGENAAGAIFSARTVPLGEKAQEREFLTLMLDGGELKSFDLAAVMQFKLAGDTLQRQLKDYLAALAVARSREKRSVYIDSSDAGSRQLRASYMIPTPVWKSSYRLIFSPTGATLEGWAIVDNTTGEDWTNVNLSLVSGRPISFISQLYEPKYKERPVAELPEDRAVAPPVHAGAIASDRADQFAKNMPAAAPPAPRRALMSEMVTVHAEPAAESTVDVNTQARELGDLFEYRFSTPVTVRKSESAMLPFLQQKITSRKLLIYSGHSLQNPMNAAEISNNSGKTLDGGPITVFDAGAYAGEALVETFKAGDKRLISYGIDLGTRITTAFDSTRDVVREFRANRGILTTKTAILETQTYTIRNVDAKPKILIIEHPVRPSYTLLTVKPAESTAAAHRFEVKLAANSTEKFAVPEERLLEQSITILSLTPDQIGVYVQNRNLTPEGRKQLEAVAAAKRQIADTDTQIRDLDQEINELVRDQDRIRQNLSSLNRVTGQQEQVNRYANELASQEAKLASLRDRAGQLRKQKAAQDQQLKSIIEKMTF
ncbi:MAG: DUF4139 domain-containing protein [Bryobacterales bacterium]|nr:DUF4139 domain-containing protein [Bryobacterales bacterium]